MENPALAGALTATLAKADAILGYVRQVPLDKLLKCGREFDWQISAQLSEKEWRLIVFALDAAVTAALEADECRGTTD